MELWIREQACHGFWWLRYVPVYRDATAQDRAGQVAGFVHCQLCQTIRI